MRSHAKRQRELEAFVRKAVAKARALAGPQIDTEDLEQAAKLAILEAESNMPRLDVAHDIKYLRTRVVQALKTEILAFNKQDAVSMNLDDLLEDETEEPALVVASPMRLAWDGETSDEAVSKSEITDHVREVVEGMAPETAQVVRLCFGLDGGDAVAPIDVADILDESPEVVLSHLWAAEKLFRHFSADGHHRRLTRMTDFEFQAFYKIGDLAWYDLRDLNLNNADLRECDLSNAVLSGMNLWGVKLAGGNAESANLWGAQLEGADMHGANLSSANFERAGLRGADLRKANASNAIFWGADLAGLAADHADFSGCDLRSANLSGADLTRTDLSGADLRGANLAGAKLVGADLDGANMRGVELAGADFRWADLRHSDLSWSNLSAADTRGASLQGAVRSPKMNGMFAGKAPRPQRLRPVATSA
ncbi:MAG: pentapeptide repeat-containing protein [Acidimicrobiales bacterium]